MQTFRPALSLALAFFALSARAADAPLIYEKAVPAPDLDALFQRTDGWVGADGAFSVALSPQRTLWLFSDTWVGKVRDSKRSGVTMVNNTVGVQTGNGADAKIDFSVRTGAGGKPASLIAPGDKKGWYWLLAAAYTREHLCLFLAQIEKTSEPGAFGFRHFAQNLGIVANPFDAPADWRVEEHALPFTEFSKTRTITFGAAALVDDGYLYAYGFDEDLAPKSSGKRMILARVKTDAITDTSAWRFFKDGEWQTDFHSCSRLAENVAAEYSVTYLPALKKYVAVYTDGGLSRKIVARSAAEPWGPWSAAIVLFECPEMSWNKQIFCYAAKAHPMLAASDNELVVSYVANAFDWTRVMNDARLYWPRFVRVKIKIP